MRQSFLSRCHRLTSDINSVGDAIPQKKDSTWMSALNAAMNATHVLILKMISVINASLFHISMFIFLVIQLFSFQVQADPVAPSFTYQGRLFNEAGTAPMTGTVDLRLGILSASGTCLLYEELHTGINLNDSAGVFSVEVGSTLGSAKRTTNDPGLQMANLFANPGSQILSTNANCPGGYTPASSDYRLLSVTVIQGGSPTVLSPHQKILSQPTALVAETLQGIGPSGFIRVTGNITQANLATLTGGGDATALHRHDSRYVQLGSTSAQNLGSGNVLTTGQLGVGAGAPAAGVDIHVQRASPTLRLESTASGGGTGGLEFYSGSTQRARIASPEGSSELQFSTGGSNALIINDQQDASFLGDITTAGNITASGFVNLGNYTNAQEAALITPYLDTDCGVSCLGTMWMNTDLSALRYWDGTSAQTLALFGGTQTAGGAVYSDGTSMRSTVAGTAGQVLTSQGSGAPVWSAVDDASKLPLAGGTMTGAINMDGQNINLATGDIENADQITANRLNINADGQVLLGARAQLLMGNFSNAEETTYIGTLAAGDAGKIWYNSSIDVLKYWDGAGVQALGISGSGLTSLNGLTDAVQTFTTPGTSGTAPAWTSATGVHTLNIPMAATAGVTAGLISKTEFDAFNAKLDSDPQLADIAGLTPADGAFIVGDGSNFVTESAATARTSLGLGTMATETATNYVLRDGSTPLTANWDVGGFNINNFTAQILSGDATSPGLRFSGASTNTGIFSPADDVVAVSTNGVERFRISEIGRVGIGTNAPSSNLHVAGETTLLSRSVNDVFGFSLIFRKDRNGGAVAPDNSLGNILFGGRDPSIMRDVARISAAVDGTVGNNNLPSRIEFATSPSGTATPVERMRIANNGHVGIATTNPTSTLHVLGNVNIENTGNNPVLRLSRDGTPAVALRSAGTSGLSIQNGSTTTTWMTINGDGNMAIGPQAATARLDVAGQIKIAEGTEGCTVAGDAGRIRYNASNQLQYCNGSAWQTLGVAGSGLTNFNGQTGSTQSLAIGAAGTAPAFVSATDTHTLNIPLASGAGVTSGTISKTDFDAFTAKQDGDAQLTDVAAIDPTTTQGYMLSSNGTNLVMRAPADARADLGLGTMATETAVNYVLRDGTRAMTAAFDAGSFVINNVADPTSAQQAATKAYVDTAVSGASGDYVATDGSTPLTANWNAGGFNINNFTAELINGTAGAPALRFPGASTNTGIFSPGDDILALSTNGNERFRIAANGNIGIGTQTSPEFIFDVRGTSNPTRIKISNQSTGANSDIQFGQGPAGTQYGFMGYDGNAMYIDTRSGSTYPIQLKTQGSTRMTVLSTGEVGVGTTNPGSRFEVAGGSGGVNTLLTEIRTNASANNTGTSFALTNSTVSGSALGSVRLGAIRTNNPLNGNTDFTLSTYGDGGGMGERLRVKDNGLVGIGTTTPRARLDVNGAIVSAPAVAPEASATIDYGLKNISYTDSNCQAFVLHNLKNGGSYTLIVKGTTSATCSFTAFSDAGSTSLTVRLPPGHGATIAGEMTVYTFIVAGSDVFVAWIPGYN